MQATVYRDPEPLSGYTTDAVVGAAAQKGINIYTINAHDWDSYGQRDCIPEQFSALATGTGGRYYETGSWWVEPSPWQLLIQVLEDISQDAVNP